MRMPTYISLLNETFSVARKMPFYAKDTSRVVLGFERESENEACIVLLGKLFCCVNKSRYPVLYGVMALFFHDCNNYYFEIKEKRKEILAYYGIV